MADLSRFSRLSRLGQKRPPVILILVLIVFLGACQVDSRMINPLPGDIVANIPDGMSTKEAKTLSSLYQISDFPLYTMVYEGNIPSGVESSATRRYLEEPAWACSLFAAYGEPDEILYGRNFDWDFSPALLLFMDPPGGYASVSMVDIHYLGFGGEQAFGINGLTLDEQVGLLDAPYIPFDGMNEKGLAIGMAAVPPGGMELDPAKETVDSLMVILKILDGAATVDEAVEIIRSYNIDMGNTPIHYLISEK
ncbi:MAG: linear amide C-N hydrolase, partial [Anaerolineales bacterium]|nr:linear amide C-N hydrolase [Anaerolineales bacterium]